MITKESLKERRESTNIAFLELKQQYSSNEDKIYWIVEGKDDFTYYSYLLKKLNTKTQCKILRANSRDNVIKIYETIDWETFSKERIFFFIDRDLSDILKEYIPDSDNFYVTDYYSIENSIFTRELMVGVLEMYYLRDELKHNQKNHILNLYDNATTQHERLFRYIMSWIVHWRSNKINCHLNNLHPERLYTIQQGQFQRSAQYNNDNSVAVFIHQSCNVQYNMINDLNKYTKEIDNNGGIRKYIRGKYLRVFFIQFLKSIASSFAQIFTGTKNLTANTTISPDNAITLFGGLITPPQSLRNFLHSHGII